MINLVLADAQKCKQSSFYLGMRLLPKKRRAAMLILYRLCDTLDDLADGDAPLEERRAGLCAWRDAVTQYAKAETHQLPSKLVDVIETYQLPTDAILGLIDAMQQDVDSQIWLPNEADLMDYCYGAASCVGLLSIRIFGCTAAESEQFAIHLGRALQLINIWRDVEEDLARGRIYLAREWLGTMAEQFAQHHPVDTVSLRTITRPFIGKAIMRELALARRHIAAQDRRKLFPAFIMMHRYELMWYRLWKEQKGKPSAIKIIWRALGDALLPRRVAH